MGRLDGEQPCRKGPVCCGGPHAAYASERAVAAKDNHIVGCISKCGRGTAGRESDCSPLFGTCETIKAVRGLDHMIIKEKQRGGFVQP